MSLQMRDLVPTEADLLASLAPPEAARAYMNPVEDDTWVRHAELVRMEQLRALASDADTVAKREVVRDYVSTASTMTSRESPTGAVAGTTRNLSDEAAAMEGMAWQERFLDEYKQQRAVEDHSRVLTYKQQMMENFRRKRGAASRTEPEI